MVLLPLKNYNSLDVSRYKLYLHNTSLYIKIISMLMKWYFYRCVLLIFNILHNEYFVKGEPADPLIFKYSVWCFLRDLAIFFISFMQSRVVPTFPTLLCLSFQYFFNLRQSMSIRIFTVFSLYYEQTKNMLFCFAEYYLKLYHKWDIHILIHLPHLTFNWSIKYNNIYPLSYLFHKLMLTCSIFKRHLISSKNSVRFLGFDQIVIQIVTI